MGSGKLFTFIGLQADRTTAMTMSKSQYVTALGYSWLTRFYDPVVAFTSREKVFRETLLEHAEIRTGDQSLDLACGTETFAVMVKVQYPGVKIAGLDVDPRIPVMAPRLCCPL